MNPELYKRYSDQRRVEMRRDAEVWRLLRQGRRDRPGRLAGHARQLLSLWGHWLVELGRRLQTYDRYRHGELES
jgi:hypothetical protein